MTDYIYYNRNPDKVEIKDCVCRAISTATTLNYDGVNNLLEISAKLNKCDKLCVCCYKHLLEKVLCYERIDVGFKHTVIEIAKRYPRDTLILRVDRHLTCSVKGSVLDIWDCHNELVDCFWIIE